MMPPRIGPIHGVHPAPRARARGRDPGSPRGFSSEKERVSWERVLGLATRIFGIPEGMRTKPPMIRNHGLEKTADPINPEAAPSETKIRDSPTLKASEFTITQRRVDERSSVCCFRRSMLTPEIKEI